MDTNVVLRLVVAEDEKLTALAEATLAEGAYLSHGVLMETEWVLRGVYRLPRGEVNRSLSNLISLTGVTVERPVQTRWALDRHREGADWADMLHLIAARPTESFGTFDRSLARKAGEEAPVPVRLLA